MSRIGKRPIPVPAGVTVAIDGNALTVKGPKGELSRVLPADMVLSQEGAELLVKRPSDEERHKALHGLTRTLVANMVEGVTKGFTRTLEITGVGYKAAVAGKKLQLSLGFSHDVNYDIPAGIAIVTPKPTEIMVSGIDKRQVGQVAAEIRAYRGPEPYKGKGVKYADEFIFRKEGKKK